MFQLGALGALLILLAVSPWPPDGMRFDTVPLLIVVFAGGLIGFALGRGTALPGGTGGGPPVPGPLRAALDTIRSNPKIAAGCIIALFILGALILHPTGLATAILATVFAACSVVTLSRGLEAVKTEEVAVHTSWGGLGGGLGGWRLSQSATMFLLAAIFAGAAVGTLAIRLSPEPPDPAAASAPKNTTPPGAPGK